MTDNTWNYRDDTWNGDLVGYDVEATDGSIGKVDAKSNEASSSYVVVDTGFWIFGKKRLIPAGAVTAADHERKTVSVSMTKDEIKNAPDYNDAALDGSTRTSYEDYYGPYSQR